MVDIHNLVVAQIRMFWQTTLSIIVFGVPGLWNPILLTLKRLRFVDVHPLQKEILWNIMGPCVTGSIAIALIANILYVYT